MALQVPMNSISDIELALQTSKKIESMLKENFKAVGKGLHEELTNAIRNYNAAMSVFNLRFPSDLEKKIRKIASIRNQIVHEESVTAIADRNGFIRTANEINSALFALNQDMFDKNIQIQNVPMPVQVPRGGPQVQGEGYLQMGSVQPMPVTQVIVVNSQPQPQPMYDDTATIVCMYVTACISVFIPLVGLIAMCVFRCGANMSGRRKTAFMVLCVATVIGCILSLFLYYGNTE